MKSKVFVWSNETVRWVIFGGQLTYHKYVMAMFVIFPLIGQRACALSLSNQMLKLKF